MSIEDNRNKDPKAFHKEANMDESNTSNNFSNNTNQVELSNERSQSSAFTLL